MLALPVLVVLGCSFIFLILPSLLNHYLIPRLMAELPFPVELSLCSITPWKMSGTLSLADTDRTSLSVPRFELYYTPVSLLRGNIVGLLVDSASLHHKIQSGHSNVRDLSGHDSADIRQKDRNDNLSAVILPLTIENITFKNCTFTLHQDRQDTNMTLVDGHFKLDFVDLPGSKKLLTTATGQLTTSGDLALTSRISLKSNDTGYEATASVSRLQFKQNDLIFATAATKQPITLQLTGNLEKAKYTLTNFFLTEPELASLSINGEIEATNGTFRGIGHIFLNRAKSSVAFDFSGANQNSKTSIDYALSGEAITIADTSFTPFKAEGNVAIDGATLAVKLNGNIPEITFKKSKTQLVNLSFQLPLHYPPLQANTPGFLKIEQIRYQDNNSGALQATISQSPKGIKASTLLTIPFVPGLQVICDGSAQLPEDITVRCRIPATKINSATFPRFLGFPDKLSLTGTITTDGAFHLTDKLPLTGKMVVEYHNGTLTQGKSMLSDINVAVVFPHLPLLQSAPGQLCTIASVDFGRIKMSDGRMRFRIEDEQSIFLEKMQLNWCGGKVESGSFTLAKNIKKLETTLYCDRLGFTELLAQFGIDKAEGQGSLNGRLPMVISPKGVMFDDGFLFSTPGNGGIVRFSDTRQLRQGIPDINKSSYLDYSMKALENFSYNWTKLSFNSQDKDLLITMQLDGKPAEPLPFSYKNGQLVPNATGFGLQQPVRLDVNFRLPMNDLLHYGTSIQSMLEKM